jgi:tetratricopeptide (TPR) repeat protein
MHPRTQRAFQLLGASRPDLAASEFRAALADDPSEGHALAGLAFALNALDKDAEALETAKAAVAAQPDLAMARGAHAQCLLSASRYREALAEANAAIELEPLHSGYHGTAAFASLQLGLAQDALRNAERGLALDADDELCANVRGMALVRLNRRDHAEVTLRTALARDPESPFVHATLGHTLLTQGKVKEAAEHFRQALRRDPTSALAREGLMHTLRSRFIVYRAVLWWLSFCTRMPRNVLIGVLVASFVLPQLLSSIAKSSPAAALFIVPVRLLLLSFVLLTWVGVPLFDGLLLLSRDGRLLLTRAERWWGLGTLALLLGVPICIVWAIGDKVHRETAILTGASCFLLLAPIGFASGAWTRPNRRWIGVGALAALMALAGYSIATLSLAPLAYATFGFVILSNVDGLATARRA